MEDNFQELERRRYIRLDPRDDISCEIEGVEVFHLVGISSDGSGMRVITDRPLPPNPKITIYLGKQQTPINGVARIIWQEMWDFEFCTRHITGITLEGVSEEDRRKITQHLPKPSSCNNL